MKKGKKLADLRDIPERVPQALNIGSKSFLVVRDGDQACVCGNICPHYGAPLDEGLLDGGEIVCPWHGARFNLENGKNTAPPALDDIPVYDVSIEEGGVFVGAVHEQEPMPRKAGDDRTFVIVGAGAAGNAAAEELRKQGFSGGLIVFGDEIYLPYDRPMLSKGILSGESSPESLALRDGDFYASLDIDLRTGQRVVVVDPINQRLSLENGGQQDYDKLLLATGGTPVRPPLPGIDLPGCFTLRSQKDARSIVAQLASIERNNPQKAASMTVLILGAGFLGLEAATALRTRGFQVVVAAPEPIPLATVFGETVGRGIQSLHEAQGIEFRLGCTVRRIEGNSGRQRIFLSDGNVLESAMVLIAAGIRPSVGFLAGSDLVHEGQVPVNGLLETRQPHIYAAGDIAALQTTTGRAFRVEHWATAQAQGRHAAQSMLGATNPFIELPFFWTVQQGNSIKFAGVPDFDQVVFQGKAEADSFLSGYFKAGRLQAVATAGRAKAFFAGAVLLRKGISIDPEAFQTADLQDWIRINSGGV